MINPLRDYIREYKKWTGEPLESEALTSVFRASHITHVHYADSGQPEFSVHPFFWPVNCIAIGAADNAE